LGPFFWAVANNGVRPRHFILESIPFSRVDVCGMCRRHPRRRLSDCWLAVLTPGLSSGDPSFLRRGDPLGQGSSQPAQASGTEPLGLGAVAHRDGLDNRPVDRPSRSVYGSAIFGWTKKAPRLDSRRGPGLLPFGWLGGRSPYTSSDSWARLLVRRSGRDRGCVWVVTSFSRAWPAGLDSAPLTEVGWKQRLTMETVGQT
jgi:hypothetical protein